MKLNGAFDKSTSQNRRKISQKEPIKAGSSKAVEIPGTKAKCLGIEFQKNFFELVQLGNLQNGMESHTVLKSVQLKWDNTFSLHGPRTLALAIIILFTAIYQAFSCGSGPVF